MIVEVLRNCKDLTYTEETIRDFILEHPQTFIDLSIKDLSKQCNVGMASVARLCTKLGFSGFKAFKVAFLKDFKDMERIDQAKVITPFDQFTSLDKIINDLPYIYDRAIGYTKISLNKYVVQRVVEKMQQSTIMIFGTGINKSVGEIFAYKVEELGILCKSFDSVHYQFIDSLHMRGVPLFGILLSHRGENKSVIEAAKYLKRNKVPTLLICSKVSEEIREYCDEILYIIPTYSTREFSNTLFMTAEQYLLDVIYSLLLVKNMQLVTHVGSDKKYAKLYEGDKHGKKIK